MRYKLVCLLVLGVGNLMAQSFYPGQFKNKQKVTATPVVAESFDLRDVTLLPGRVKENQDRDSAWMANISIDRLLHSFYNNAGVWAGREGGYMTVKNMVGGNLLIANLEDTPRVI